MRFLLVVLAFIGVGCAGGVGGISDYRDWLKYGRQVNSWGEYLNYDDIGEALKGYAYQDQYWGKNRDYTRDNRERYRNTRNEEYVIRPNYDTEPNDYSDYFDKNTYNKIQDGRIKSQNLDKNYGYADVNIVGLGNNDREDLIRPCALEDWQCIRKYFAMNSKCSAMHGPVPDPLYLKRNTLYYPNFNLTQLLTKLRITGLGSIKISEFYVNKDSGNLVVALNFKNLNESTPRAYYRYKRTAKESIVLNDYTSIEFSSGTFTAVIPKIPDLRLDLAEIHANIDDANPKFSIGPEASNSKDPDVIIAFAEFISNFPTAIREAFLFQSQLLTAIYIQENIYAISDLN